MNFKTTIVLLVLLAAAGVAVFFTGKSTPPADQTTQSTDSAAGKKLLPDLNTADIARLVIEPADGKRIVLKRDGLNWHLTEPVDAAAETNPPREILSDLAALASTGRVSVTGADAAATGLNPPQFKIEAVDKSGHSTKLDVGARSGTGDQLYVHLDGADQADLVQADLYDLLDKPVSDFRRKKLLDVNSADVQRVVVDRPEGELVLQKVGTNWVVQKPSIMPADTSAVTDLILGLSGLTANSFVADTDPNPVRFGLDAPAITITYTATTPANLASTQPTTTTSDVTVKFGMLDVRKQNVYVSTSDSTAVAKVAASSMDAFKKNAIDLRDKEVLNIDPASVSAITIKTQLPATTQPTTRPASETSFTLDRRPLVASTSNASTQPTTGMAATQPVKHAVWEIASATPPTDAGDSKVDALLSALHPLRVTQYDATPTTTPANADHYTINLQCPPPLISSYTIELTDPGNGQPLRGSYNGLNFQVDRSLLDKIKADFTHRDEPGTSAIPPATPPSATPPSGP
jgi:hypothetical protein